MKGDIQGDLDFKAQKLQHKERKIKYRPDTLLEGPSEQSMGLDLRNLQITSNLTSISLC